MHLYCTIYLQTSIIMKEIRTEIIINAPYQRVWKVLTNFKQYPAWNPFIVSVEGIPALGTTLKTTMVTSGKKQTFAPMITKLVPEQQFEWLGSLPLGLFKGNHYFQLEAIGPDQTKLIHGERFSGLFWKPIMARIGAETLQNFKNMNLAIKYEPCHESGSRKVNYPTRLMLLAT